MHDASNDKNRKVPRQIFLLPDLFLATVELQHMYTKENKSALFYGTVPFSGLGKCRIFNGQLKHFHKRSKIIAPGVKEKPVAGSGGTLRLRT